jgi:hypothetical protein
MTLSLSEERANEIQISSARRDIERLQRTQAKREVARTKLYTDGVQTGSGNAPMAAQLRPRKRR